MHLLKYVVRSDWREMTDEMAQESITLWRALLGLVALSLLASVPVFILCPPRPWRHIAYTVVSSCLFIGFSIWAILREDRRGTLLAAAATLLLAAAAAGGGLLQPQPGAQEDPVAALIPIAGSLAMLSSLGIMAITHNHRPEEAQRLGVTTESWPANVVVGVAIGPVFAVHLMLAGHFAGLEPARRPEWTVLLWQVAFWAGLRGLGDELLFRGLGFHLLRERLNRGFWGTVLPLTAANLLAYAVAGYPVLLNSTGPWIYIYVAAIALLNAALREWRRSLIPCLVTTVSFNAVLLLGLGYHL